MKRYVDSIKERIEGRGDVFSKKRNAQIVKSITSGVAAKVVSMGSGLITIPMTLKYLGVEQFGIWMAISSFVGFLNFTDLGLGIGLQNALSRCHGLNELEKPKLYISSTYFIVSLMTVLMLLAVFVISFFVPISNLIKIEDVGNIGLINMTFLMVVVISLIGIPASLIHRILIGYQMGSVANKLSLIGSLLALISIFVSVSFKLPLSSLVVLFIGAPLLVNIVYSIFYFVNTKEHRPNLSAISRKIIKEVGGTGLWSILAQLTYTLKVNAPVLIISSNIGTIAVAQYTTTQKIFGIIGMVTTMALQPLWPAYGEAYYRGDKKWMRKTFKYSIKIIALITIPGFFLMMYLGIPIIKIWTSSKDVLPSKELLMACNVSIIGLGLNTAFVMVSNGTNKLMLPTIIGLFMTLTAIFLAKDFEWIMKWTAEIFANVSSKNTLSVESIIWTFTIICDILPAFFYYQISKYIIIKM